MALKGHLRFSHSKLKSLCFGRDRNSTGLNEGVGSAFLVRVHVCNVLPRFVHARLP